MFSMDADRRFAARDDSVFPFARGVVWSVSIMTVTMGWILAAGSMVFSVTYVNTEDRTLWSVCGTAVTRASWDSGVNLPLRKGLDVYYNPVRPILWYGTSSKDGVRKVDVGLIGALVVPSLGILLWARKCASRA